MKGTRTVKHFLGLGGCAAGAQDPPSVQQHWNPAVLLADCAPWDGAATSIVLSDAKQTPELNRRPLLRLSIVGG